MKASNKFGMKAVVDLKEHKGGKRLVYRNLTEVHFNAPISHTITAFESDIHGTGVTINTADIAEIEITLETELAEHI